MGLNLETVQRVRDYINPAFNTAADKVPPLHWFIHKVPPCDITSFGLGCGKEAARQIRKGNIRVGFGWAVAGAVADYLDGRSADAQNKKSAKGEFLDSMLDRFFDRDILLAMADHADNMGWDTEAAFARIGAGMSPTVSYLRGIAESEGIPVREQGPGTRLWRVLAILGCLAVPKQGTWKIGLGYIAGATSVTALQRLRNLFPPEFADEFDKTCFEGQYTQAQEKALLGLVRTGLAYLLTRDPDVAALTTIDSYAKMKKEIVLKDPNMRPTFFDWVIGNGLLLLEKIVPRDKRDYVRLIHSTYIQLGALKDFSDIEKQNGG